MKKETDSSELLAIRCAELAVQMFRAISRNEFLAATALAERCLLLAELASGKCSPKMRSALQEMKQFQ